jgi:hypothetical protein
LLCALLLDHAALAPTVVSGGPPETFAAEAEARLPPFEGEPARPRGGVSVDRRFSLGAELVELRASYLDRREEAASWNGPVSPPQRRRHFSLLATSSPFSGRLVGEAEVAYGSLGAPEGCGCEAPPKMLRLAVKGSAGGFGYGVDFRSIDEGFAPAAGARFAAAREQALLWGERSFGAVRLRGSIEEVREKAAGASGERPVVNAGVSLSWNGRPWGAALASSYSEREGEETRVLANALSASYQPSPALRLGSQLGLENEWAERAGSVRQVPSLRFTFGYSPLPDLRLAGDSSLRWIFGAAQPRALPSQSAGAGLEWRIGSSPAAETTLSFRLEYSLAPDPAAAARSPSRFSGMLRLNVAPRKSR